MWIVYANCCEKEAVSREFEPSLRWLSPPDRFVSVAGIEDVKSMRSTPGARTGRNTSWKF